jgi:hypothetical protein
MATRMQQRRGTASQWTNANPILNAGEIGWESDNNKFKIGDGTNTWSNLDYFIDETALDTTLGDYVETSDLGIANGVATLDGSGKLTSTQLPNLEEITADEMDAVLTAGTGVTKVYDDPNSTLTLSIGQSVATTDNVTFGTVTASLTGNVTGNVSGNVTGNVTGNVSGNVTGNLTGNVSGNVTGDVTGNVSGNAGTVTNGVYTTGSTMTGYLTLNADPSQALHAATKQYVDGVAEGLHVHASAVAATTANINLSTDVENGDVLDGVTLSTGDRILVKNQTTQSQNGIYVVAASGAPSRAADFDSPAEIDGGDFIFVIGGTTQDNTGWVQTNIVGTIGTDPIAFSQFSGSGTYTAGNGLTLTGNAFSINTGTTVDLSTSQTLTNKTVNLSNNTLSGTLSEFNTALSGADFASLAGAETLTNKTVALGSNTVSGTLAEFNTAVTDADLASLATSQTLTNKTIALGSNTVSGTLAQFNTAVTDADLASLAGTETLTNKTLTSPTITGPTVTGTSNVQQLLEKVTVSATAATGTVNYDLLTNGAVTYYTSNASGNWTLNVRGDGSNTLNSVMAIGQSLTLAFMVTNGGTAYYQTGFQVDGGAITPKWQGGTAPSAGNTSSIDIYSVTIVKTANATFTAFIAQTRFA